MGGGRFMSSGQTGYIVAAADERVRTLLPVYLVTTGADYRQEVCRRPNGAAFYQFLCVLKGEGIFESPEGAFALKEGMIVFTARDLPMFYRGVTEDFRTGWVTYDGPQAGAIQEYFHVRDLAVLESESVRMQILDTYRRAERNAPAEELSSCVFQLMVMFFGELSQGRKLPKLQRAKSYIRERYRENLSVADMAKAAGISESLLYRIFREEEKVTPIDYLRSVRLQKAKELLLLGDRKMKISDVAFQTGFSHTAYFCKVFREETGMTPETYRKRYEL